MKNTRIDARSFRPAEIGKMPKEGLTKRKTACRRGRMRCSSEKNEATKPFVRAQGPIL